MFPIAPPPSAKPPSKEKQALLARQYAEELVEDGVDAVYVDSIPRGAIPLGESVYADRGTRKLRAQQNAAHADHWSINHGPSQRYFKERCYISPSKVAGQVVLSRIPGPSKKEIDNAVLNEEKEA